MRGLIQTAKKNNNIVTDYVYDWTTEIENKPVKEVFLAPKKSESMNKQVGVSVNKPFEQQKSTNILHDEKLKPHVPMPIGNSLQNKNSILTSNNKQPVVLPNTIGSRHEIKATGIKQKTLNGILGGGDFDVMGTKFTGPKISIVKR